MDSTMDGFFQYLIELNLDNAEDLELTFEGTELEKEMTFREANIVNGALLVLAPRREEGDQGIKVDVLYGAPDYSEKISLKLDPSSDVWDILKLIEAADVGLHSQKIYLTKEIDGEEIELDEEGSLDEYDIAAGDVLKVVHI